LRRGEFCAAQVSGDREGKILPLIHGKPGQVNADNTDQK
jgi:hypothetical protein